mgnify:CR=1 FL=1
MLVRVKYGDKHGVDLLSESRPGASSSSRPSRSHQVAFKRTGTRPPGSHYERKSRPHRTCTLPAPVPPTSSVNDDGESSRSSDAHLRSRKAKSAQCSSRLECLKEAAHCSQIPTTGTMICPVGPACLSTPTCATKTVLPHACPP